MPSASYPTAPEITWPFTKPVPASAQFVASAITMLAPTSQAVDSTPLRACSEGLQVFSRHKMVNQTRIRGRIIQALIGHLGAVRLPH